MSQSTTTRVQVTVEVINLQPWEAETPTGKIYERAKEHALQQVDSAIRGGEIKLDRSGSMRIIGEPRVSLVMTEDK